MLNQAFNTKPYNDFDPASFLVHFHGPKPHEYLAFLDSGQCEFFNVCEQGVLRYGRAGAGRTGCRTLVYVVVQYVPERVAGTPSFWTYHISGAVLNICSWLACVQSRWPSHHAASMRTYPLAQPSRPFV